MFLEGRMPGQRKPLQHARSAIGQLSKQCVDQDAEDDMTPMREAISSPLS
jgi:hypothetical protein